jgi:hypothetical protein
VFLKNFEREHFVGEARCNPRKVPIHNLKNKFHTWNKPFNFSWEELHDFLWEGENKDMNRQDIPKKLKDDSKMEFYL